MAAAGCCSAARKVPSAGTVAATPVSVACVQSADHTRAVADMAAGPGRGGRALQQSVWEVGAPVNTSGLAETLINSTMWLEADKDSLTQYAMRSLPGSYADATTPVNGEKVPVGPGRLWRPAPPGASWTRAPAVSRRRARVPLCERRATVASRAAAPPCSRHCALHRVCWALRATRARLPGRPQAVDRQAAGRATRTPPQAVANMHAPRRNKQTHWKGVAHSGGKAGALPRRLTGGGKAQAPPCRSIVAARQGRGRAGRLQVPPGAGPGAGCGGRAGRGALPAALGAGDARGGRRHELAGLPEHRGAADAGAPRPGSAHACWAWPDAGPCCGHPARPGPARAAGTEQPECIALCT